MPKQTDTQQGDRVNEAITASLWALARSIEQAGKLHESLDPYLKLVETYPESKEAPLAAQRLLTIVEYLRGVGQFHLHRLQQGFVLLALERAHLRDVLGFMLRATSSSAPCWRVPRAR